MEQNETRSQTPSQDSRLDRFGDKIHVFTDEERLKGNKYISQKRKVANSLNSFKHGYYSNRVPHCHTCIFKSKCTAYDPKDPKAACKVIDIPNYLHLMSALTFTSEQEFDDFINKQMQRAFMKNLTANDQKQILDFVTIILKVKDTKFRTPQEQTINLQINNFTSEFQVLKDVTIKVLNKHPEVMQEWRAAIESAKQPN
ncbi:MAG: hypothetical protein ABIE55_01190 [Candidatus Aenigmatarchaeota archaeon]